jgi:hypothetical protein
MQVHLALPGLLWPAKALPDVMFDLELPALAWLLGRARHHRSEAASIETWLARRLGHGDAAPPLAALRLLGEDGDPGAADWICADPAHFAFEHGRPLLADPAALGLGAEEIAEIAAALAPIFHDVGSFHLRPSGHGYLELAAAADIDAPPLSAAIGRGAAALLPSGRDAARWLRLANEAQIALHALELNRRREASRRPTVNTLWFWGAGRLPAATASPYANVGGGGTLARGLARHAGAAWHADADRQARGDRTLLIDERLLAPVQQLDAEGWREALRALERERLAPLAGALRHGRLRHLTLTGLGDEATLDLELARGDALRFWRRPRTLVEALTP